MELAGFVCVISNWLTPLMKQEKLGIRFWGTRGSFPVGTSASLLRERMVEAVELSRGRDLTDRISVEAFVDSIFPGKIPPLYGTNTSCVEITNGGAAHIICDAGSGLYSCGAQLLEEGKSTGETYHIFITHLHWDHIQGFPFFDPIYISGNKVVVHGFHEKLEEAFRLQMSPPFFPVPFSELKADISFEVHDVSKPFEVDGITVSGIEQKHPGVSYGYRFEGRGKAVVYSTDSEHTQGVRSEGYPFIDFFKDADLLIFDGMYSSEDDVPKLEWGHSSSMMGVELAHRANVGHLVLFHHDPTRTDEELEGFLHKAKTYAKERSYSLPNQISSAYDGWILDL